MEPNNSSNLTDDQLIQQAFAKDPAKTLEVVRSMSPDHQQALSDQTLQMLANHVQPNQPKQIRDNYKDPSFGQFIGRAITGDPEALDSLGAATSAFGQGLIAIPAKLKYEILGTVGSIANGLGIIPDKNYQAGMKRLKKELSNSIDYNNPDVKRFPGLTNNVQDLGSLVAEVYGVGKISKLIGLGGEAATRGGQIVSDAINASAQSGIVSALQGEPGSKASSALIGAGIGGTVGGLSSALSGALSSSLGQGKPQAELTHTVEQQNQVEAQTGIPLSLQQRLGNTSVSDQYQSAQNTVQDIVKPYVPDISSIDKSSITAPDTGTNIKVLNAFIKAEKQAKSASDSMYKSFLDTTDSKISRVQPVNALNTIAQLQQDLAKSSSPYSDLAEKTMNKIGNNLSGMKPSEVYDWQQQLTQQINKINKQGKNISPQDQEVVSVLVKVRDAFGQDLYEAADHAGTVDIYNAATQNFKDTVASLRAAKVDVSKGAPAVTRLMGFLQNPSQQPIAANIINQMGNEGQIALKTHIATDVLTKSLDENGQVNPNLFAKNYKAALSNYKILYGNEDHTILKGMSKLINTAGPIPSSAQVSILQSGVLKGVVDPVANLVKFMANTKTGQNILLTLGRLPGTSPQATQTINALRKLAFDINVAATAKLSKAMAERSASQNSMNPEQPSQ